MAYTFDELKKDVDAGTIDTVLAVLVDMQGRLMGKRFHARFFVDGAYEETHSCNYLLATDMETSALLAVAQALGLSAATLCLGTVDGISQQKLDTTRLDEGEARLFRIALCALTA